MAAQSVKSSGAGEDAEKRERKRHRHRAGRRRRHRTSVSSLGSSPTPRLMMATADCVLSEEGIDSGDDSEICFGCLFKDLQRLKLDTGILNISVAHPYFVFIMDKLAAKGVEEILKRRWENQLESLNDFVANYGDCLVPNEHPVLGEWVRVQRDHYKRYKKRLPSQLTKERFMKLEAIVGFCEFGIEGGECDLEEADQGRIKPEPSTVCFDCIFAELQKFKEDKGTCIIAKTHPSFTSIMEKLSVAGVEELLRKRWENQLDSLRDFADKYGDCSVPIEHPYLGEWVRVQRDHYELFKKRLPSPMTRERFSKLKEIVGFDEVTFENVKEAKKSGNDSVVDAGLNLKGSISSLLDKKLSFKTKLVSKARSRKKVAHETSTVTKKNNNNEVKSRMEVDKKHSSLVSSRSLASHATADRNESTAIAYKDKPNRRATDNHLGAPTPAGAIKNKPNRRATDNYVGRPVPAGELNNRPSGPPKDTSTSVRPKTRRGSTFEERLQRKLKGDSLEEIYNERKQPLTAEALKNKHNRRAADNYLGRSMPEGALNNRPSGPSKSMSAKMPPNTLKGSTFEERLQPKVHGESLEEINKKRKQSLTVDDLIRGASLGTKDSGDSDSVGSWGSFDGLDNDHVPDWRSKLNSTGLKSKDDIGLESWSDMDASLTENKFSRWRLLFELRRYDSKKEQLDYVESVLDTIIHADKWDVLPNDNGDIAIKMTTQTLDEHKTVEQSVQQLGNIFELYSDFYFY